MAGGGWGNDPSAPWGKKVGKHPTDRGKTGTKRRMLTDGHGVPLGMAVDDAHRHDFKMAGETRERITAERPDPPPDAPQELCLNKGDNYDEVGELPGEFGFIAHIRARGEEAKVLKQEAEFNARRWVGEHTHSCK